jgi:hypothetical protein
MDNVLSREQALAGLSVVLSDILAGRFRYDIEIVRQVTK